MIIPYGDAPALLPKASGGRRKQEVIVSMGMFLMAPISKLRGKLEDEGRTL